VGRQGARHLGCVADEESTLTARRAEGKPPHPDGAPSAGTTPQHAPPPYVHAPPNWPFQTFFLAVRVAAQMQQLLDVLSTLCDLFGMTVNLAKTRAVALAPAGMKRSKALRGCTWHYREQPVRVDAEYTHLGLLFDEKRGCEAAK